jgi:RNA polymerase sigma-70 factor, ECF subfamily
VEETAPIAVTSASFPALLKGKRTRSVELEDVFRTHQRAVFAYFLRVVGDRHAAEELTQETFVRACGAVLRFRGDAPVEHWLFAIARRVLLEASRKGLFRRGHGLEGIDPPAPADDHDQRIDLERAFSALDRSDRETLVLVDLLGFTPAEAAALVRAEPATFRMRLHRARRRLRERLEVRTP